jgi:hypothetical protein
MLRKAAAQGRIQWQQHTLECFLERGISRPEVVGAIMNGEVIESYAAHDRTRVVSCCTSGRSRCTWRSPPRVTLHRIPGAHVKMVHRFCAVKGDMKTRRRVAQWSEQQVKARRLDAATEANLRELGYGEP